MKLSKRAAGALLLAAGAGVLAAQGAAAAEPMTSGQVAALEDHLSTQEVPFEIPLGAATDRLPLLPEGGKISGGIPTSLVMPPVPAEQPRHHVLPEEVVPSLTAGRVGPALNADLPLPIADRSTRLGDLVADVPAIPIKTAGPALELGQPVSYVEGTSDELASGQMEFGEIKPQLITKPVQAIPGASASLGGQDDRISVTDAVRNLTETTGATVAAAADQSEL
ncbi:hypothetical protein ACFC1R_17860 [Kitasatospora sp. NPDC056138]|uniref:hypothetical protein n=1 Tax=Kitasatospora sp. NPDC056138 TaxID=3345724 RepID=UPI0035E16F47